LKSTTILRASISFFQALVKGHHASLATPITQVVRLLLVSQQAYKEAQQVRDRQIKKAEQRYELDYLVDIGTFADFGHGVVSSDMNLSLFLTWKKMSQVPRRTDTLKIYLRMFTTFLEGNPYHTATVKTYDRSFVTALAATCWVLGQPGLARTGRQLARSLSIRGIDSHPESPKEKLRSKHEADIAQLNEIALNNWIMAPDAKGPTIYLPQLYNKPAKYRFTLPGRNTLKRRIASPSTQFAHFVSYFPWKVESTCRYIGEELCYERNVRKHSREAV
jgi:hypothetical protein